MKTLTLSLKKKWFDMIASGEKTEEYREITLYWQKRLLRCGGVCNGYCVLMKMAAGKPTSLDVG